MFLKRIELAGFKSFADRTIIDFEPGVTAVVGPNGSGKSNITEAIRWVLGEQSAKNLRGGKMPDIIFAGSDTRNALNVAEVTVVLDNVDHYLPLDFSEVSVTRRYRRTGESDFFINKQACRLRDIQDLFMDSGLGKESFSIISQGKVEAIFSSKPEDRRGIFEEAAGVLKYKQRKRKAEQKLFETEDNLNRLQDIIYELEEQLAPLDEQSKAAQKYLELKDELTAVDVSLTVSEIAEAKAIWDEKQVTFKKLEQQLTAIGQSITRQESQLVDLRQKRARYDQDLEQGQQQLLYLTETLKQTEGQKNVLAERSKNREKSQQEYQDQLSDVKNKVTELERSLADLQAKYAAKSKEIKAQETLVAQLQAEAVKYQKSSREVIEELRAQYVELMQEQAKNGNELNHLERQYQQETAKNQQGLAQYEELQEQAAKLKARQVTAEQALTDVQDILTSARAAYQEKAAAQTAQREKLEKARSQMFQLMNQVQQVKGRQKSLQDIHENYTGFYQGVRAVLQHKDQLSGIVGAVAELIETKKQYALAVETALGGAAQHIVVEGVADAKQGITFLKQQRAGRATFLPLATTKPRFIQPNVYQKAQAVPGFLGVASDLITYPETIKPVIDNLLGTVLFAEDLDSASAIARTIGYQNRVVSLEGDVMNAGGSMTGGATKRSGQGLLSQNQELQQLTETVAKAEEKLLEQEKLVQRLEQSGHSIISELETLRDQGEQERLKEQECQNNLQNITNELTRINKDLELYAFESREIRAFLENYQTEKAKLTARQEALEAEKLAIDQEMATFTAESDQLEERKAAIQTDLSQAQAQFAVMKEQLAHLKHQEADISSRLTEAQTSSQMLEGQLLALTDNSSLQEESEESLARRLSELTKKKTLITEELATDKKERQALQTTISAGDEELTKLNRQQKELLAEQTRVEVQKNRAELQLDNSLNYLQEEYYLTFDGARDNYPPVADLAAARQEVKNLKQQIERLGPVNLNAIEQFQQVNERHEFLAMQRDDLLAAKEQLFDTMKEMDDEVKVRFKTTFDAIRKRFKEVFPNMFGGGRAELVLTDPTDLLNTGIEIEAQPPGKKLQNLSLLSGGERALTAIALLFAIIQVRPVPFCVLDEVEAALDEANVTRFGRYLGEFQNDTQFIVVTHRKGTMEAADVLYGVTMEESGVSKVVSVRLEQVKDDGKINL